MCLHGFSQVPVVWDNFIELKFHIFIVSDGGTFGQIWCCSLRAHRAGKNLFILNWKTLLTLHLYNSFGVMDLIWIHPLQHVFDLVLTPQASLCLVLLPLCWGSLSAWLQIYAWSSLRVKYPSIFQQFKSYPTMYESHFSSFQCISCPLCVYLYDWFSGFGH